MPTVSIETISPAKAEEYLSKNQHNRHVKVKKVEQYAREMTQGRWRSTGESISFYGDGTLANGQHRLLACIESKVAFECVVVRGVDTDAQLVIDTGAKRSFSDYLQINGYTSATNLAAATSFAYKYDKYVKEGKWPQNIGITHTDMIQWLRKNDDIRQHVNQGTEISKYSGYAKSLSIALRYLFQREIGWEESANFWMQVAYGPNGESTTEQRETFRSLRRWTENARQPQKSISQEMYAAMAIKTFNAWMLNQEIKALRWAPGGSSPEKFPLIVSVDQVLGGE
jgi:hypothetical protein